MKNHLQNPLVQIGLVGLAVVILFVGVFVTERNERNREEASFAELGLTNLAAKQYLSAGADHYQKAIDEVDEPEMKAKIADYCRKEIIRKTWLSQSEHVRVLKTALELTPTSQKAKNEVIASGMRTVAFLIDKDDDRCLNHAVNLLESFIKHTADLEKRNDLMAKAVPIYESLVEMSSVHNEKGMYLSRISNLTKEQL